jgi:type I restriction enzyme S subunit
MEVKPGYKQTEVGVIPEEWDAVPLKGKVSIAHGFAFASEHFASHGPYRLATPGHFYEKGGFRDIGEKQKYYVGPVPSDYVLQPGDVIVAMTEQADGLLGSAAVIPDEHGYLHNQRLGRATVLSSEIQLDYLVYVFNSPSYRTKVRETAAGTKVKHTSPEKLLEISVRLPPLHEQRAIATTLNDVDGLLGGLDRLIAKKRDLKQAAMQQLLTGQTRLPGFHGEWEVKRLGEVGSTYGGLTGKAKADFGEGPARYITFMNVMSNVLIDCGTFEQVQVSPTESQNRAKKGDLFFNGSSETPEEVAMCSVLLDEVRDVYLNSFCFGFRFHDGAEADGLFLAYYLRSKEGRELMKSLAQGSTRYNLSKVALLKSPLRLPKLPEQTAIASVLTEMDGELAVLEQRREKTRALKQAMMQELLTGRTRLL